MPGQPNRAELDRAIDRGTRSYIRDFVEPSYVAVSNGGYVDYKDSEGTVKRYGPKAYVAYQLYLLTHFLMYYQDFGVDPESELFRKVRDWFVEEFDGRTGSWLWSHEGCLHAKGMIALANLGRSSLVRKAYDWALRSPLSLPYLPPSSLPVSDRIFTHHAIGQHHPDPGQRPELPHRQARLGSMAARSPTWRTAPNCCTRSCKPGFPPPTLV